jgi:hypothetical protein
MLLMQNIKAPVLASGLSYLCYFGSGDATPADDKFDIEEIIKRHSQNTAGQQCLRMLLLHDLDSG